MPRVKARGVFTLDAGEALQLDLLPDGLQEHAGMLHGFEGHRPVHAANSLFDVEAVGLVRVGQDAVVGLDGHRPSDDVLRHDYDVIVCVTSVG